MRLLQLFIFTVLFLFSGKINAQSDITVYQTLKQDILKNEEFKNYKAKMKKEKGTLNFSKYDNPFCTYALSYRKSIPDSIIYKCKKNKKNYVEKTIDKIDVLNEKNKKNSFVVIFSEIKDNYIIVDIATVGDLTNSRLIMVYKINAKNSVTFLTSGITLS